MSPLKINLILEYNWSLSWFLSLWMGVFSKNGPNEPFYQFQEYEQIKIKYCDESTPLAEYGL